MRRSILLVLFVAAIGVLGACTNTPDVTKPAPNAAPSPAATAASPAASPAVNPSVDPKAPTAPSAKVTALEGKWPGVEGTSLNITKNGEKYKVEITGADKKTETFDGTAKGDLIEFKRKDKVETIKAATAEETGMKWLAGEKNCVVVTKGSEGYCRK
jgi:hypothetical protein